MRRKRTCAVRSAPPFPFALSFLLFFLPLFTGGASPVRAEDRWYVSNAAGMALEPAFSRLALRGEYALRVTEILPGDLPPNLREYYDRLYREAALSEADGEEASDAPFSLRLEKRIIYKDREASRLQWLFLDRENLPRLAAAFAVDPVDYPPPETAIEADDDADTGAETVENSDVPSVDVPSVDDTEDGETDGDNEDNGEADEESEGEKITVDYSGYIELYNSEGYIIEEQLFSSDSSGRTVNYYYNGQRLIRAVTKLFYPADGTEESRVEDYCTDNYRYSRSSSLRGVERVYHAVADAETQAEPLRLRFPHVVLGAAKNDQFVNPAVSFSNEFFMDILVDSGSRVLYTTDERGRVLTETRRNEEGEVTGELRNTWSGDRLVSIHWKAGDDERVTEFQYNDDGDRTLERNINRGVLEREVTIDKDADRETEVLYIDGKPMLKAVWENGRKVSEERIRPSPAGAGF
jgi:hypothetical protein